MSNPTCPSLQDLLVAPADRSPEVIEHLSACLRCRALVRHAERTGEQLPIIPLRPDHQAEAPVEAAEPSIGDIFTIRAYGVEEYLVAAIVDLGRHEAVVVPLSTEVARATDFDLLLDRRILGYAVAAQNWNYGTVLREQLAEKLASLGPMGEPLSRSHDAVLRSEPLPEGLPRGVAIVSDDDSRLLSQEDDATRLLRWWEPALVLSGASDVGELMRLRRNELGLDDSLDGTADAETIRALEGGQLSLLDDVPSRILVAALRRLQIRASGLLASLIEASARASLPSGEGLAFNRRRRSSGAPARTSEERADEYAREVVRQLDEEWQWEK